ncbi:MAG: hypothetical protein WBA18_00180 [Terracidiphilus sp.]
MELSADRANAARRLLQQDGVRRDQVTQVRGYADQFLRVKSNPYDPSNRRISILVKNQEGSSPPQLAHAQVVSGGTGAGGSAAPAAAPAPSAAQTQPAKPATPAATTQASKPGIFGKLTAMTPGKKK